MMIRLGILVALMLSLAKASAQQFEVLFSSNLGRNPSGNLVQGGDGSFYGTTRLGGANDRGTVFKITPTGTLTVLHSFNYTDGHQPNATLLAGEEGNFYGTTMTCGPGGFGVVFRITHTGTFTILRSFDGSKAAYR